MNVNPFYINPAKIPANYIQRPMETESIIEAFSQEEPSEYGKYIVGVRGSGKTVLMNYVCDRLDEMGIISVRINPMADLYDSAIDGLRNHKEAKKILISSKVNFGISLTGMSAGVELEHINTSTKESVLRSIVSELTKKKKRVLFSIDEVYKCDSLAMFSQTLQTMVGFDKSDILILMTGLPNNVKSVKSDKRSSFLARILEVETTPLSDYGITFSYHSLLGIPREDAKELAKYVKGYSYAFQLLGYLLWEAKKKKIDEKILEAYEATLFSSQYDLIWDELSDIEKDIMNAIAISETGKVESILKNLTISGNMFNQYRRKLIEKKLIDNKRHGYISFTLPRMDEYVRYIVL